MPKPLVLVAHLTPADQNRLAAAVRQLDWPENSEFKGADRYHVTVMYSKVGGDDEQASRWVRQRCAGQSFAGQLTGLDIFTSTNPEKADPVVVRLHAPQLQRFAEELLDDAPAHGLQPSRFDERFHAHITVGFATSLPSGELPALELPLGPLSFWD